MVNDFISAANAALDADGCHQVRRSEDGGIELIDGAGRVLAIFTPQISADDLVGASLAIANAWDNARSLGERSKIRDVQKWVAELKRSYDTNLTVQHIEAAIAEDVAWYEERDAEEAEEEAAHRAAESS